MKWIAILVSLSVMPVAFGKEFDCKGVYRKFTQDKLIGQTMIPMVVVLDTPADIRFEADVEDQALVASITKTDAQALLSIIDAPAYTTGINSRVTLSSGYGSTSKIVEDVKYSVKDGEVVKTPTGVYTLYKIECYVY